MGHSKASLLEEMRGLGGEIMAILIESDAAIKPDYLAVPKDADDFKMSFIRDAHTWLLEIQATYLAEYKRIRKMQPEEMWLRYEKWGGFDEYREVQLLKKAVVNLRAAVVSRGRPDFFKRSKRGDKKNKTKAGLLKTEKPGVQDPGAGK